MLSLRSEEKADRFSGYTRSVAGVSDAFANPTGDGFHAFSVAYPTGMPTAPRQNPFAGMRLQLRSRSAPIVGAGSIMCPMRQIIADDVLRSTTVTVGRRPNALASMGRSL